MFIGNTFVLCNKSVVVGTIAYTYTLNLLNGKGSNLKKITLSTKYVNKVYSLLSESVVLFLGGDLKVLSNDKIWNGEHIQCANFRCSRMLITICVIIKIVLPGTRSHNMNSTHPDESIRIALKVAKLNPIYIPNIKVFKASLRRRLGDA
jgi:hypothetical protein